MKAKPGKDINRIFAEGVLVEEAVRQGVREAIRRHRQAGQFVVIWRNSRPEWVPAETLEKEIERSGEAG